MGDWYISLAKAIIAAGFGYLATKMNNDRKDAR